MTHLAEGEELSLRDLSVALDRTPIVKSVALTVRKGAFTGLIGPNGSGKSTLLRAIARVIAPSGGSVWMGADNVAKLPRRALARRLALVAQNTSTELDLTVLDVALLGRVPHQGPWQGSSETDTAIAMHHLEEVGMDGLAERSWHTLSGGEQQRVHLARAFTQEPTVLALDEPTNHLDIKHALALLASVQHSGLTVVAALHDINLAAAFCDDLIVLSGGTVVASGTPLDVLTPHLLKEVYDVESEVRIDEVTDRPVITFYPPRFSHAGARLEP
jgi:iron complex transport system ATP-binding protein